MAKNLYDQTTEAGRLAAAILCGISGFMAGFDTKLREMPPLPDGFTLGDVARAYLRAKLAELDATRAANQADLDRVISMRFTPMEKECVLHRLTAWDCFEEVFADTDDMEHLAPDAAERAAVLSKALEDSKDGVLEINGTELDAAIIREAIEGSVWMGVVGNEEKAVQARHWRSINGAARKIEAALGVPENDISVPEA